MVYTQTQAAHEQPHDSRHKIVRPDVPSSRSRVSGVLGRTLARRHGHFRVDLLEGQTVRKGDGRPIRRVSPRLHIPAIFLLD